jgi:PAS domain S-box-containing protein
MARRPDLGTDDPTPGDALDALPRAVLVMSPDGRIQFWNDAAEPIYGWTRSEVLGQSILEVFTLAGAASRGPELLAAVREGAERDGAFSI